MFLPIFKNIWEKFSDIAILVKFGENIRENSNFEKFFGKISGALKKFLKYF